MAQVPAVEPTAVAGAPAVVVDRAEAKVAAVGHGADPEPEGPLVDSAPQAAVVVAARVAVAPAAPARPSATLAGMAPYGALKQVRMASADLVPTHS